jgi:hypothetical protein
VTGQALEPQPRVLIATWYRWPSSARIAAALVAQGASVDVVCPAFHPILSVRGLSRRFGFQIFSRTKSLARAIEASQPELIISCDDIALGDLDKLRRLTPSLASTIERSFGGPETFKVLTSRVALVEAALEAGAPCPPTGEAPDQEALNRWLEEHGTPAFLKLEGTTGGEGVRLAQGPVGAAAAFDGLMRRPSAVQAIRHFLKRQEFSKARAWLGRTPMRVSVQKRVPGVPANCSAFAWRGEIRAIVSVEVLRTTKEFGIATQVRLIEDAAIDAAARALAQRLGLSGVFGLDFMVDKDTGQVWLIEVNRRPTQISHLAQGPGRDIVTAILSTIRNSPVSARPALPASPPIALFPHCLQSGAQNDEASDDLPIEQPGLIRAFTPLFWRFGRVSESTNSRGSAAGAPTTQHS